MSEPDLYSLYEGNEVSGNFFVKKTPPDSLALIETLDDDTQQIHWYTSRWLRRSRRRLFRRATGDVLIFGVALGYDCLLTAQKPAVTSVTGVEKSQEVMDIIELNLTHPKLTLVNDNLKHFAETTTDTYDTIWVDIFADDILFFPRTKAKITELVTPLLNQDGILLFWGRQDDRWQDLIT